VENNFTDITDEELDREVQQTLNLTPYSGETYVRGSLKGRGTHVQRFRIRESLKRIDGVGRAVTRGGGVLPIMAYTGRLRPKGVPFSGFRYMKG